MRSGPPAKFLIEQKQGEEELQYSSYFISTDWLVPGKVELSCTLGRQSVDI